MEAGSVSNKPVLHTKPRSCNVAKRSCTPSLCGEAVHAGAGQWGEGGSQDIGCVPYIGGHS